MPEILDDLVDQHRARIDWDEVGLPMVRLLLVILVGLGCQVFAFWRAGRHSLGILTTVSLLGVLLPLPLVAVGARNALELEFQRLASPPHDGPPGLSVETFVTQVFLTALALGVLFVVSGFAISRVLRASGFGGGMSIGPVGGSTSLALLSWGLAWTAHTELATLSQRVGCGPWSGPELLWSRNESLAEARTVPVASFIVLLVLLAVVVAVSWLRSTPRTTRAAVVPSALMLAASGALLTESCPFFLESTISRLPFEDGLVFGKALSEFPTPDLWGPDRLELDITVAVAEKRVHLVRREVDVSELGAGIRDLNRQYDELHSSAHGLPHESQPIVVASRDSLRSELVPVLEQIATEAKTVQLAFPHATPIDRPMLGQLWSLSESGLTIALTPEPGSSPVEFLEGETYESFARRAIETRKAGPIHLELPTTLPHRER